MRLWIAAGAASGFIAVAVGSLAAHGLGEGFPAEAADWIEIGLRYQFTHALALLAVALFEGRAGAPARALRVAGWGFVLGTVLFSGVLYLMALTGWRALGLVVPLGGLSFLVGWAALFAYGLGLRLGSESRRST